MRYLKTLATRPSSRTPQSRPIPGSTQAPNSAAGFTWAVDDWMRLERFLLLGSEGGSYYASEQKLTRENAAAVLRCLAADGGRAVERIAVVSEAGRAPKNDPALFALALAAAEGDAATRRAALAALPRVARTGTHLLHFAAFAEGFRGWGRGLRRAVADWYTGRGTPSWPTSSSSTRRATAGRTATCCAWRTRSRRPRRAGRCTVGSRRAGRASARSRTRTRGCA